MTHSGCPFFRVLTQRHRVIRYSAFPPPNPRTGDSGSQHLDRRGTRGTGAPRHRLQHATSRVARHTGGGRRSHPCPPTTTPASCPPITALGRRRVPPTRRGGSGVAAGSTSSALPIPTRRYGCWSSTAPVGMRLLSGPSSGLWTTWPTPCYRRGDASGDAEPGGRARCGVGIARSSRQVAATAATSWGGQRPRTPACRSCSHRTAPADGHRPPVRPRRGRTAVQPKRRISNSAGGATVVGQNGCPAGASNTPRAAARYSARAAPKASASCPASPSRSAGSQIQLHDRRCGRDRTLAVHDSLHD